MRNIPAHVWVKTKVEADLDYTAQFDLGESPLLSANTG